MHLVASVHSGHTSAVQVLARFGAAARSDPRYAILAAPQRSWQQFGGARRVGGPPIKRAQGTKEQPTSIPTSPQTLPAQSGDNLRLTVRQLLASEPGAPDGELLSLPIYQGTHESKTFRQARKRTDGIFANDLACRRIDFLDQLISGGGIHAKPIGLP